MSVTDYEAPESCAGCGELISVSDNHAGEIREEESTGDLYHPSCFVKMEENRAEREGVARFESLMETGGYPL